MRILKEFATLYKIHFILFLLFLMSAFTKSKSNFGVVSVRAVRPRRPIDKFLVNVSKVGVDGTQVQTIIRTATTACTVTGLRWDLATSQQAATGAAKGRWAIVIVRDGLSAQTMAISDASSLYDPEQDVMAFGSWTIDNNVESFHWVGDTKTMRKLRIGDAIIFIAVGVATNTSNVEGVIQMFCKS